MNLTTGVLLLLSLIFHEGYTRQIPQHKGNFYLKRGTLKNFLKHFYSPSKRGLNLFDDRAIKEINLLASESDWLKKIKSTPGKRCANLLDESCSNGGVPGAAADSDWISGGNSPGKRSLGINLMDDRNIPYNRDSYITPGKRCANLLDESCSNGGVPGAAADSDWISGGNSPGKRSFGMNLMDDRNIPFNRDSYITPGKRCANLLDESCSNGGVPGAGDDSDWINGGDNPGKRSWNLIDDHNVPVAPSNNIVTPGKRCANLLDESCSNGGIPGAASDSAWISGGNSPGKRALGINLMDDRNIPFNRDSYITPGKRCANLLDESCNNGEVPDAGGDSDWINGGDTPGK